MHSHPFFLNPPTTYLKHARTTTRTPRPGFLPHLDGRTGTRPVLLPQDPDSGSFAHRSCHCQSPGSPVPTRPESPAHAAHLPTCGPRPGRVVGSPFMLAGRLSPSCSQNGRLPTGSARTALESIPDRCSLHNMTARRLHALRIHPPRPPAQASRGFPRHSPMPLSSCRLAAARANFPLCLDSLLATPVLEQNHRLPLYRSSFCPIFAPGHPGYASIFSAIKRAPYHGLNTHASQYCNPMPLESIVGRAGARESGKRHQHASDSTSFA